MKTRLLFFTIVFAFIAFIFLSGLGLEFYDYLECKKNLESGNPENIYSPVELEKAFESDEIKSYFVKGFEPERVSCTTTKDATIDYIYFHEHGLYISDSGDQREYSHQPLYADSIFLTEDIVLTHLSALDFWKTTEYNRLETPDSTKIYDIIFGDDKLSFLAKIGNKQIQPYTAIVKGDRNTTIEAFYKKNFIESFQNSIIFLAVSLSLMFICIYFIRKINKKNKQKREYFELLNNEATQVNNTNSNRHSRKKRKKRQVVQIRYVEKTYNKKERKDQQAEFVLLILAIIILICFMPISYIDYKECKNIYNKYNNFIENQNINNLPVINNIEDLKKAFSNEVSKYYFVDNIACDSVSALDFEGKKHVYVGCSYYKKHIVKQNRETRVEFSLITEKKFVADTLYFTDTIRICNIQNADFINCKPTEELTDIGKRELFRILPGDSMSFLAKIGGDSIAVAYFDDKQIISRGSKKDMLYDLTEKNLENANHNLKYFLFYFVFGSLLLSLFILIRIRKKRQDD